MSGDKKTYPRQSLTSCLRKRRHETLQQARQAQEHMQRKAPEARVNVYYCAFCSGFHIGTTERGQ